MDRFYLGTGEPAWLARTTVPLMIARRPLARRAGLPAATCDWMLDSGGFGELSRPTGRWRITPAQYVAEVYRYATEIGRLRWAAPMDRMCEPVILDNVGAATGHRPSVAEHQEVTVHNLLELRALAPDLPFFPVLQGWSVADYHRCADLYAAVGVDLELEPLVGVGSVCRRQGTREAEEIFTTLAERGLTLHAFGVKVDGLELYGDVVASADSFAWAQRARRSANEQRAAGADPAPMTRDCQHRAVSCSGCLTWALEWREKVIAAVPAPRDRQLALA